MSSKKAATTWHHELGLVLACASSDGSASVLTYNQGTTQWDVAKIERAHATGALAVSWAPAVPPGALVSADGAQKAVRRLVQKKFLVLRVIY